MGDQLDLNVLLNPATGYQINPTLTRADPKFTQIQWLESHGQADLASLASAFTRRFRNNFQANLTYTLMLFAHDDTTGFQSQPNNQFDRGAEWARSTEFQRHTLRASGIYRLPHDISVSGAYFYGSGNYYGTSIGLNPFEYRRRPESVQQRTRARHPRGGRRSLRRSGPRSPPATSCRAMPCAGCRCTRSTRADHQGHQARHRQDHRHRRSVQRLQPRELRRLTTPSSTRRRSAIRARTR